MSIISIDVLAINNSILDCPSLMTFQNGCDDFTILGETIIEFDFEQVLVTRVETPSGDVYYLDTDREHLLYNCQRCCGYPQICRNCPIPLNPNSCQIVNTCLTNYHGYDSTKVQIFANNEGVIEWDTVTSSGFTCADLYAANCDLTTQMSSSVNVLISIAAYSKVQSDARYFQISNNLSEGNAASMRTSLALGTAAIFPSNAFLNVVNNLSDLGNVGIALNNLGGTDVGKNIFTSPNPSAITFLRANADNSVSFLDAASFRVAIGAGSGSGSVISVSVVSINGFAGTVATSITTPAITISTTVIGLLKGNGTAISAAVAGTDYLSVLSGDVTTSGNVATLSTVNANVGTFGSASKTVTVTANAKGLITAISEQNISIMAAQISDGTLTGLNFVRLPNPSAITFVRINADNSISTLDAATFRTAIGAGTGAGTVTSVGLSGLDFTIGGTNPVTTSGTISLTLATVNGNIGTFGSTSKTVTVTANGKGLITAISEQSISITASQVSDFNTSVATTALLKANNLSDVSSASTSRTNLGATTVGANIFTLVNPSAVTWIRMNADNTVTARTAAQTLSDIGGGTGNGTVTSVAWTTSQGISALVATPTTTPNITVTLGALTGVTSFNGLIVTANTGVVTTGTWQGSLVGSTYGGTGVNNGASTITIGGNLAFSGAFATTITITGTTTVTFPTSGTLITNGVTSLSSLATVGTLTSGSLGAGFTTVVVARGGTGIATTTAYGVIHGGTTATGNFQNSGTPGASGTIYRSTGATSLPAWGADLSYLHNISVPTTGGTVNLTNNQYNIINPAGAIVALTVNLPSSPANNDVVLIKYDQAVTTVTYGNGTVNGAIASPGLGQLVVLVYDSGNSQWY